MKEVLFKIIYFPLPVFWFLIALLIFCNKDKIFFYIRILCIFFYILLTPIFSTLIEIPLMASWKEYDKNDNIATVLVPTAGIFRDMQSKWHPSSNTILRVSSGESIARLLGKPLLISGGVLNEEGTSEADTVKKIISYDNVTYDNESKNSYETALNLKRYIKEIFPKEKILIVTSPKHSLRMSLLLSSRGFSNAVLKENLNDKISFFSFMPDVRSINSINGSLYEYMAILKYILNNYISLKFNYE